MESQGYLVQALCCLPWQFQVTKRSPDSSEETHSCLLHRITIKTRIVLQRLLNYNPISDQPLCAQQHHRDDERIDDEDTLQRQKLLAKEPEVAERYTRRWMLSS